MSPPSPESESPTEDLLLAYVFIPLPERIALPDEWQLSFNRVHQDIAPPPLDFGEVYLDEARMVWGPSLIVRQVDGRRSLDEIVISIDAAAAAFGWPEGVAADHQPFSPAMPTLQTIVEVAMPVAGTDMDSLQKAIDVAIARIEDVQRAYVGAAQHVVGVLTRNRLPPAILCSWRTVRWHESEPTWPPPDQSILVPNLSSDHFDRSPSSVAPERLNALGDVHAKGETGPLGPLLATRRDLSLALRSGSHRPTAILFGVSAEVLIREQLLMLLWEEGRDPAWSATRIAEWSVVKLVRREFHQRLGGEWKTDGAGPVARWFSDIVDLRNRTVHAGYVPSAVEIADATTAYADLERFFGDRLAASVARYPLAAREFCGSAGLERRGAAQRLREVLQADPFVPTEINAQFSRFRFEVNRALRGGPYVGNVETSVLVHLMYVSGSEAWWLLDMASQLGCRAQPPALSEAQEKTMARVRAEWADAQPESHLSSRVEAVTAPLEEVPEWRLASEILPLRSYARHAQSLLPPPKASTP